MQYLKHNIQFPAELFLPSRLAFKCAFILLALLLSSCQIAHADLFVREDTRELNDFSINSVIRTEQFTENPEPSLLDGQDNKSWLSFGGSLGFGASYIALGVKGYVRTPYVRVFALIGLGVGAGVDIKLGNLFELGLTRATVLGGSSWDVVALRYHPRGSFGKGWFVGIEYIANRRSLGDTDTDGNEPGWFATFGYDF